ncbi:MAG: 50S ribosomal protein L1 [Methermicoccaceae archaeon]
MKKEELVDKITQAIEQAPERKFVESVDLAINLKNIDMSIPQNRVDVEIHLPKGRGNPVSVCVFAKGDNALRAKDAGAVVFPPEEIEELGADKKKARDIAEKYDFFISEPQYMPQIGKALGPILGPRGKMPKPLTPDKDIVDIIQSLSKGAVRVRSKDKKTFHVPIGRRDMAPEDIAENAYEVLSTVESTLRGGKQNIRSVYVSTTMGPSVRVM